MISNISSQNNISLSLFNSPNALNMDSADFSNTISKIEQEQNEFYSTGSQNRENKYALDGISDDFLENWFRRFLNEEDDKENESKIDVSSINDLENIQTKSADDIDFDNQNYNEQGKKDLNNDEDNDAKKTKSWDVLIADEILKSSIENNINMNLEAQIARKEAQVAYSSAM